MRCRAEGRWQNIDKSKRGDREKIKGDRVKKNSW